MKSRRGLLLFVVLFSLYWAVMPQTPDVGLDAAWPKVVSRGLSSGKQFGRDIVFTYGPLGAIVSPLADGHLIGTKIALHLGLCALVAAVSWMSWRAMPREEGIVFLSALVLCPMAPIAPLEGLLVVGMTAIALLGSRCTARREGWLLVVLCLLITIPAALSKFTLTVVSIGMVLATVAALWGAGHGIAAATMAVVWWPGMLAAGMMAGQKRGAVQSYIRWGWEVSRGYAQMSLPADPGSLAQGLIILSGGFFLILWGAWRLGKTLPSLRARLGTWAGLSAVLLALFLFWKHGFTRADGHVRIFFCFAPVILQLPALLPHAIWRRHVLACAGTVALFASMGEAPASNQRPPGNLPGGIATRIAGNWNYLLHRQRNEKESAKAWKLAAANVALPALAAITRDEPVDFLGAHLDYIFASRMKYQGRPIFQSYTAITGPLARLNAEYFSSKRAPRWLLCSLSSMGLDGHFPGSEDALAFWKVLHDYDFKAEENNILLLEKMRGDAPDPELAPVLFEGILQLGNAVPIPAVKEGCLWFQARITWNLTGKIRSGIYQQPPIWMHLKTADGQVEKFRFLPDAAEAGFLIHPCLRHNDDVRGTLTGQSAMIPAVVEITIQPAAEIAGYINPEFTCRIRRLPPLRP